MSGLGPQSIYFVKAQWLHQNRTIWFSRPFTSYEQALVFYNEILNFLNALGLAEFLTRVASIEVDAVLISEGQFRTLFGNNHPPPPRAPYSDTSYSYASSSS